LPPGGLLRAGQLLSRGSGQSLILRNGTGLPGAAARALRLLLVGAVVGPLLAVRERFGRNAKGGR